MLITCPKCESKARIATSRALSSDTREAYCQCLNLNCGVIFVTFTSVARIVEPTGERPNAELQPELCKNVDLSQIDIFES